MPRHTSRKSQRVGNRRQLETPDRSRDKDSDGQMPPPRPDARDLHSLDHDAYFAEMARQAQVSKSRPRPYLTSQE